MFRVFTFSFFLSFQVHLIIYIYMKKGQATAVSYNNLMPVKIRPEAVPNWRAEK